MSFFDSEFLPSPEESVLRLSSTVPVPVDHGWWVIPPMYPSSDFELT